MDRHIPSRRRARPWWPFATAIVLASGALLAPPASAVETSPTEGSRPTLWRAVREDGRDSFFLIGSVHLGRPDMLHFPPAVEQAYSRADELVLEVDVEEMGFEGFGDLTERYARIELPQTLRDHVSGDVLQELARYLELRGEPLAPYLSYEPWFLVTQIQAREAERIGLDPRYGVDRFFARQAEDTKPVVGLESVESQIQVLAWLPRETQEALLLDTLEHVADTRDGTEGLVRAWRVGDDAELERIVYRPMSDAPKLAAYYERMLFGRNESMTQRLASLARDGKLRFVVVGAGHMVGERGIPSLLRDYGFRVERVAYAGSEATAPGAGAAVTIRETPVELGAFVTPEATPAPGVVMIHDVWGLSEHTRDLARRLAGEGFAVLAIDLYRRERPEKIEDPGAFMRGLSDPQVLEDLAEAARFVATRPETTSRVAVLGFCMGGMYALMAACGDRGFAAAVPFYGLLSHAHGLLRDPAGADPERKPREPLAMASELGCPLLAFFGEEDEFVPMEDVRALERELAKSPAPAEVVIVPGAGHAFMNDTRPAAYRPAEAALAWRRTVAFLRDHL